MKKIQLYNSDLFAIVDDEDYEYLSHFRWIKSRRANNTCATSRYTGMIKGKATYILMHREIMNAPSGLQVDHVNRNPLDNRKENLRLCTHGQNAANQASRSESGYKGVYKIANGIYESKLTKHRKTIHLGNYTSAEGAAVAYDLKAIELHGEFASTNFSEDERKHIKVTKRDNLFYGSKSSSGYKGVVKEHKKWKSYSGNTYIGIYDSPENAALAYDFYVVHIKEESSYLNFPEEKGMINPEQSLYSNPSGYKGVIRKGNYADGSARWSVVVTKNKKRYHLGHFRDPQEGSKVYEEFVKNLEEPTTE